MTIICGTDLSAASESACELAATLAVDHTESLILVNVIPPPAVRQRSWHADTRPDVRRPHRLRVSQEVILRTDRPVLLVQAASARV
jgi:Universal stress protein family